MLLGKIKVVFAKGFCLQAGIDVTFEGQNCLAGVGRGEVRVPVVETSGIKIRQLIADPHQAGNLRCRKLACLADQLLRVIQQFRLGITLGGEDALVVERFSR